MNDLARASVRRLRVGVVAEWDMERLSVGYETIRYVVSENLDALKASVPVCPTWVRGEWGSGKTHFLAYVRAVAAQRGIPSALVSLNAHGSALNHPQRFYPKLVDQVRLGQEVHGLRGLVLRLLESDHTRRALGEFARSRESGDLSRPLGELCALWETGDHLDVNGHWSFTVLLGADLSWADYGYKRAQAIDRIAAVGLMLRAVGLGGLAMVFDEAETIDQLWNIRSRVGAYGMLSRLCRMDAVWPVFGVTERFNRTAIMDAARVSNSALAGIEDARAFLESWQNDKFLVVEPPPISLSAARRLAENVAKIYSEAYPNGQIAARLIDGSVAEWRDNPSRNPRRLIRLVIGRLDQARQH